MDRLGARVQRTTARSVASVSVAVLAVLAPVTAAAGEAAAAPSATRTAVPAPQVITVPNVVNERTFANYRTADGSAITDKVIRSANLSTLTPAGAAVLARRGVTSVIDLRTAIERQVQQDKTVPGAHRHDFDVLRTAPPTSLIDLNSAYREFITNPVARQAFRSSILDIRDTVAAGGAVVFHCTAGKDRTGWLAAVLLSILGVDRAVIDADYLASNTYRHASPNDPINGVNLGLLNTSFRTANQVYGSFAGYVHKGLRLTDADIASIKRALLR